MKYIAKKSGNEPESLKLYRETTPNATYEGFADSDQLLKKALLAEQGYICSYCMQRISLKTNKQHKLRIEVEHIASQKNYPYKALAFTNMAGVCNGNIGGMEHCDKSKKDKELHILFPHNETCEQYITYSTSGKILSRLSDGTVEIDLNEILNLNNQFLVENRRTAADLAIENLDRKYANRQWTKKQIEKEIEVYQNRDKQGRFKEFCNYVVWYLTVLKAKSKYK